MNEPINIPSPDEMIDHAKKELKMDDRFIASIMEAERYKAVAPGSTVGRIKDADFLSAKFSCQFDLDEYASADPSHQHLITGFGPTNAPTGGTLSMILRALLFHKISGIDSTIIVSNLGAFDSRNVSLEKISHYSSRFLRFIRALGYQGNLRLHNDYKMLTASAITAKALTVNDFVNNEESTAGLYRTLGIQGKDFPSFVDANFTVADILLPVFTDQKEKILVFVGIEEYYFPKLANLVLEKLRAQYGSTFAPNGAHVSGLFGRLIHGLNGFPKMSKSIPSSSINLDDDPEAIKEKILHCRPDDEKIILEMITLVSDWGETDIDRARRDHLAGGERWEKTKLAYYEYFLELKNLWDKTQKDVPIFKLADLFDEHQS